MGDLDNAHRPFLKRHDLDYREYKILILKVKHKEGLPVLIFIPWSLLPGRAYGPYTQ